MRAVSTLASLICVLYSVRACISPVAGDCSESYLPKSEAGSAS